MSRSGALWSAAALALLFTLIMGVVFYRSAGPSSAAAQAPAVVAPVTNSVLDPNATTMQPDSAVGQPLSSGEQSADSGTAGDSHEQEHEHGGDDD